MSNGINKYNKDRGSFADDSVDVKLIDKKSGGILLEMDSIQVSDFNSKIKSDLNGDNKG